MALTTTPPPPPSSDRHIIISVKGALVEVTQQSSQPVLEKVPRNKTEEVEIEAHGMDRAPEGALALNILNDTFPSEFGNVFAKENLKYYTQFVPGAVTMAMGKYMATWSELARQQ
ncbi:hypothetical protein Tco_1229800 [Tanacetum coccineum]